MPVETPAPRSVPVAPDHFEVAADDVVFTAEVSSTVVLCLYDAVEEAGAVLNLRFIARGEQRLELTDRTLATDLLLLDSCVAELRKVSPRAQNLQGKIAAHVAEELTPRATADAVLSLIRSYLEDAGVRIVSSDVSVERARLRFRPAMGQVRLDHPTAIAGSPS
jgi:chemotaxis receptor (MCP) glutamine deamidase CheD